MITLKKIPHLYVVLLCLAGCTERIVKTERQVSVEDKTATHTNREVSRQVIKKNDFVQVVPADTQTMIFPKEHWLSARPESFGWSSTKLAVAKEFFEGLQADAALVIVNGYVIASWGDPTEIIQARSLRKSYLNAVYGLYASKPTFNLNLTLGQLHMDDKQKLTSEEKLATIEDLLTSRSGVYHPAAYAAGNEMPPRGTHSHGQVFKYNNWDFNVLGTIFNQQSGQDLFTVFADQIAAPLQMQDFRLANTSYKLETESVHPAYLFATSARDDARFALLYLNHGNWNGRQMIPEEWIKRSTSKIVDTQRGTGYSGYGYLWWTDVFEGREVFLARGNSAQYIFIDPGKNVIVVFRADPGSIFKKWMGMRVSPQESWDLLRKIYEASPRR